MLEIIYIQNYLEGYNVLVYCTFKILVNYNTSQKHNISYLNVTQYFDILII